MPILEVVKVHWLDDECLSQWTWLPIWNMYDLGCCPTTKDGWSLLWANTLGMKMCFLLQVLVTFYELPKNLEAPFSL